MSIFNFRLPIMIMNHEYKDLKQINPNWHEAGRIYPPYNLRKKDLGSDRI